MNRALLFFTALLLLFSGGTFVWFSLKTNSGPSGSVSEVDPDYVAEKELTEFEFIDQFSKPFGTKDLAGTVWLGSFFFADCPSVCVQQNAEIAKLHKRFLDQDVFIVNISVAPDKDPPHKLWDYANRFDADHERWKFLTGRDIDYVRQVGIDIFTLVAADESHTTNVAVFDRNGNRHGSYNVNNPMEFARLVMKVEELLAEPASAEATSESEGLEVANADPSQDT